jgi:serine protease Do
MNAVSKRLLTGVAIAVLIFLAACGGGKQATTEPQPKATAVEVATAVPAPTNTSAPTVPAGLVTTLDDVKSATIQIEAQGTFQDPQVGLVVNGAGRGSGFIIDPSGIAVTNNHVVTGAALLKVWVGGDKEKVYNARVLGASECSDLAVIKIDGADFKYLAWHEGTPKVGLEVYAAGYPLGDPVFTLTKGIVSKANADGKTSWASVGSVLQHDASINPGNSGGPLVDANGNVVGVNYASNNSNQYFAIARAEADQILNELKGGKDVNSIGVNGQVVMSDDQTLSGVWVSSVKSGSPADKSGVKSGDIITEVEGLVLGTDGTMSDYCQILRSHQPTDTLSMTVLRWQTQEVLEGQLNGRELAVSYTYDSGQTQTDATQAPSSDNGMVVVADDSDVIAMQAPTDWQYDGSPWESTWTINGIENAFTAQTLTVSPDVNAYNKGWDTIGIFVATSRDWGSLGGYANLMEGIQAFYKDCQPNGNRKYDDGTHEGMMQMYKNCGDAKINAVALALRPKVNPQSYLLWVEVKYFTQAEFDLLDQMYTGMAVVP